MVTLFSRPDTLGRQQDELWKKSLDAIGVQMDVHKDKLPGTAQAGSSAGHEPPGGVDPGYPDGDNFMQLLYGPNTGATISAASRFGI